MKLRNAIFIIIEEIYKGNLSNNDVELIFVDMEKYTKANINHTDMNENNWQKEL